VEEKMKFVPFEHDWTLAEVKSRFNTPEEFEKRNLALYRQLSGYDLALEVAATKPTLVIDIGCGGNVFKEYIAAVSGIDIVPHPNVDVVDDIHNAGQYYEPESADWIFNFGPLQYTDPNRQVEMMANLLKPGGTIVAHTNVRAPWSIEYIKTLGEAFGLTLDSIDISYTVTGIMNEEDYKIQTKVSAWKNNEFSMENFVAPRLTWRWYK
jgi:SAM-dependent methyltransferase